LHITTDANASASRSKHRLISKQLLFRSTGLGFSPRVSGRAWNRDRFDSYVTDHKAREQSTTTTNLPALEDQFCNRPISPHFAGSTSRFGVVPGGCETHSPYHGGWIERHDKPRIFFLPYSVFLFFFSSGSSTTKIFHSSMDTSVHTGVFRKLTSNGGCKILSLVSQDMSGSG
jgi:hypothetical protein